MRSWTYRAVLSLVFASLLSTEGETEEAPVLRILYPTVSEGDMIQHPDSSLRVSGIASAEGEIARVTVNGQDAHLTEATGKDLEVEGMATEDKGVRFYFDVSLHLEKSEITVVATDKDQRTTKMTFTVERIHRPRGNVYALVIGINEYRDKAIQDLRFAENDAEAIYEFLTGSEHSPVRKENANENVKFIRGKNATADNIKRGMYQHLIKKAARPEDMVIFFYSGHGGVGLHPTKGSEYYLIPSDGELEDLFVTGIEKDEMQRLWSAIVAQRKVFISDACHAAGFEGMKGASTQGLGEALGEGRITFSAAMANQESLEIPELEHGIFTHCLLEGLKGEADTEKYGNEDGLVSVWELAGFLQREVPAWATKAGGRQTPQIEIQSTGIILSNVDPPRKGYLLVEGTPSWAQVTVGGNPLQGWQDGKLKQSIGKYHVVASLLGYEPQRTMMHIEENQEIQWTFGLHPKSRWKAAGKSAILPGWGQLYEDRTVRGGLLLAIQLASVGAAVWSHLEYAGVEQDYEDAVRRYDAATSLGQLFSIQGDVQQAYKDLSDAFDRRQLLGLAAGAVWGASVLDAAIAGPRQYKGPSEPAVTPLVSPTGLGIAVHF